MQATTILTDEHRVIQRVLDMLLTTVERIDRDEHVPEGFAHWSINFFRQYADQGHHHKEEEILFPMLCERGIPHEGGPIGVMLCEHELGRDCVLRMEQGAAAGKAGMHEFAAASVEYIRHLQQHIAKEDQVLFPMAERCLSEEDDQKIIQAYQQDAIDMELSFMQQKFQKEVGQWEEEFSQLSVAG